MALSENNTYLASEFIALKARVKAECARRRYNGSVASYASAAYDYTVTPQSGNPVLPEHVNKIVEPVNAITPTGYKTVHSGEIIKALQNVSDTLTYLESVPITYNGASCNGTCTGLCYGTCTGGCRGTCTGSCTGGCLQSCSGNCSAACADTCSGSCATWCEVNCSEECDNLCAQTCVSTCIGGCKGECKGTCTGSIMNDPSPV